MDLPEDIRAEVEKVISENPELVEKYGNPLDKNDPQFWTPTERKEKGLAVEDRLAFLEKDMEIVTQSLGNAVMWIREEKYRQMNQRIQDALTDPTKAQELLKDLLGPGAANTNYAGSTQGLSPETLVDTVNGKVRVDQIPGYENTPDWRPSEEWVNDNCTCPEHSANREAANKFGINPYKNNDDNPPNGMYL